MTSTPARPLAVTAVAVVAVLGVAALEPSEVRADRRAPVAVAHLGATTAAAHRRPTTPRRVERRVETAVRAAERHEALPSPLRPAVSALRHNLASVGRCDYSTHTRRLCRRGDRSATRVIVVFGDSHGRAWIPAVQKIAQRRGLAAYYLVKQGCTAANVTPVHSGVVATGCVRWRRWAVRQIAQLRPALLAVASAMPEALIRERGAIVRGARDKARMIRRGLIETLHVVERAAKATVVVSDPPGLRESARTCLAEPSADLGDCAWSPPIAASLLFDAQRSAATEVGVRFASTRRWFCASGLCPAVVGSTVAYRDDGHMTTVYARSLNRALQAALLTAS